MFVPETAVPGYPYEEALFSLLGTESPPVDKGPVVRRVGEHNLIYGCALEEVIPNAAALAALFETIQFAPSLSSLPEGTTLTMESDPYDGEWKPLQVNAELRVRMRFMPPDGFGVFDEGLVAVLLERPAIKRILEDIPMAPQWKNDAYYKVFLNRMLSQLRTAKDTNGVILCGKRYNALIARSAVELGDYVKSLLPEFDKPVWGLTSDELDVVGLHFGSATLDGFAAVRQSTDICEYAREFRTAVAKSFGTESPQDELTRLMERALKTASIAKATSGAFSAVGSTTNVGGLFPFVGTVSSLVGIGADAAGKYADAVEEVSSWYMIGPEMERVALEDRLRKLRKRRRK